MMDRTEFKKFFKAPGVVILPVIHMLDFEQTARNIMIAATEGVPGVFLINHDFPYSQLLPIVQQVRQRFPALWFGVNFLGVTGRDAFPVLGGLSAQGVKVDAYWADDARIDECADQQKEADDIAAIRESSGWDGFYFGGAAFKKQREVEAMKYGLSARIASRYMDSVTTSGVATGKPAALSKIEAFRRGCGDTPLTVASGVTPDNIGDYVGMVDAILVATGINHPGDFYNIDPARLQRLISIAHRVSISRENETGPAQ